MHLVLKQALRPHDICVGSGTDRHPTRQIAPSGPWCGDEVRGGGSWWVGGPRRTGASVPRLRFEVQAIARTESRARRNTACQRFQDNSRSLMRRAPRTT